MNIGSLIASIGADIAPLQQAVQQAQAEVRGASAAMARSMEQFNQRLRDTGKQMTQVGKSMSFAITAPLLAAGVGAFKLNKDFEASMSKIVGLVGVAQSQVGAWSKDILEMAPRLGKGPAELADALFFVTSAGIRGSEAMDVLEMSAKASAAGLGETKVVADLVTSAMNAYGSENISAAQATDIMVAAVREGKAEAPELTAAMGKVLPIASEMKVSFDQVAAAIAAMTRTGTEANQASTSLRAILTSLYKPSKQAEDALKGMGTSSSALRKSIREDGLLIALQTLRELTSENEEAMGLVVPNVRALTGVLDLMGSNAEDNAKIFDVLTNATGSLDHAFEAASETAEFKWQQALASNKTAMVVFGETVKKAFIPILESVSKALQALTSWFTDLSDSTKKWMLIIAGIAAALGPILIILGQLLIALAAIGKAFVAIRAKVLLFNVAMVKAGGAMKALSIAMAKNPFGAAALAITTVAYALYQMHNRIDAVTQTMNELSKRTQDMVAQEGAEIKKLTGILLSSAVATEQRTEALQKLVDLSPEYFGLLEQEEVNIDKVDLAVNRYTASLSASQMQVSKWGSILQSTTATEQMKAEALTELTAVNEKLFGSLKIGTSNIEDIQAAMTSYTQTIADEHSQVTGLITKLTDENTTREDKKKALKELSEISKEYMGNLSLEMINTGKLTEATENYTKSLEKKARVKAAEEMLIEVERKYLEAVKTGSDKRVTFWQKAWNSIIAGSQKSYALMDEMNADSAESNAKAFREAYEKEKSFLMNIVITTLIEDSEIQEIYHRTFEEIEDLENKFIGLGESAEWSSVKAAEAIRTKYLVALEEAKEEIISTTGEVQEKAKKEKQSIETSIQAVNKYIHTSEQARKTAEEAYWAAIQASEEAVKAEQKRIASLGIVARMEESLKNAREAQSNAQTTTELKNALKRQTALQKDIEKLQSILDWMNEFPDKVTSEIELKFTTDDATGDFKLDETSIPVEFDVNWQDAKTEVERFFDEAKRYNIDFNKGFKDLSVSRAMMIASEMDERIALARKHGKDVTELEQQKNNMMTELQNEILTQHRDQQKTELELFEERATKELEAFEGSEEKKTELLQLHTIIREQIIAASTERENALRDSTLERILQASMTELDYLKDLKQKDLELTNWTEAERAMIIEYWDNLIKQRKIETDLELAARLIGSAQQLFSAIGQMQAAAMEEELKQAGDNEEQKTAIRKQYAEKRKSTAIAEAVMGVALAVINAMQTVPFVPAGLMAAAAATAMGIAQIATISATSFAKGGIITQPTLGLVGEYPGANVDPEIISPLSTLKQVMETTLKDSITPAEIVEIERKFTTNLKSSLGSVETNQKTNIPLMADGGLLYGETIIKAGEYPGADVNPEVIAPLETLKSLISGVFKTQEKSDIQEFAKGGLLYGETIIKAGEYPGVASNPEVIAPLTDLKKMMFDLFDTSSGQDFSSALKEVFSSLLRNNTNQAQRLSDQRVNSIEKLGGKSVFNGLLQRLTDNRYNTLTQQQTAVKSPGNALETVLSNLRDSVLSLNQSIGFSRSTNERITDNREQSERIESLRMSIKTIETSVSELAASTTDNVVENFKQVLETGDAQISTISQTNSATEQTNGIESLRTQITNLEDSITSVAETKNQQRKSLNLLETRNVNIETLSQANSLRNQQEQINALETVINTLTNLSQSTTQQSQTSSETSQSSQSSQSSETSQTQQTIPIAVGQLQTLKSYLVKSQTTTDLATNQKLQSQINVLNETINTLAQSTNAEHQTSSDSYRDIEHQITQLQTLKQELQTLKILNETVIRNQVLNQVDTTSNTIETLSTATTETLSTATSSDHINKTHNELTDLQNKIGTLKIVADVQFPSETLDKITQLQTKLGNISTPPSTSTLQPSEILQPSQPSDTLQSQQTAHIESLRAQVGTMERIVTELATITTTSVSESLRQSLETISSQINTISQNTNNTEIKNLSAQAELIESIVSKLVSDRSNNVTDKEDNSKQSYQLKDMFSSVDHAISSLSQIVQDTEKQITDSSAFLRQIETISSVDNASSVDNTTIKSTGFLKQSTDYLQRLVTLQTVGQNILRETKDTVKEDSGFVSLQEIMVSANRELISSLQTTDSFAEKSIESVTELIQNNTSADRLTTHLPATGEVDEIFVHGKIANDVIYLSNERHSRTRTIVE